MSLIGAGAHFSGALSRSPTELPNALIGCKPDRVDLADLLPCGKVSIITFRPQQRDCLLSERGFA